jgi:hypothetical protein
MGGLVFLMYLIVVALPFVVLHRRVAHVKIRHIFLTFFSSVVLYIFIVITCLVVVALEDKNVIDWGWIADGMVDGSVPGLVVPVFVLYPILIVYSAWLLSGREFKVWVLMALVVGVCIPFVLAPVLFAGWFYLAGFIYSLLGAPFHFGF